MIFDYLQIQWSNKHIDYATKPFGRNEKTIFSSCFLKALRFHNLIQRLYINLMKTYDFKRNNKNQSILLMISRGNLLFYTSEQSYQKNLSLNFDIKDWNLKDNIQDWVLTSSKHYNHNKFDSDILNPLLLGISIAWSYLIDE